MRDGSVVASPRLRSAGLLLFGILIGGSLFIGRVVELLFTAHADGARVVSLLIIAAGSTVLGILLTFALILAVRTQWSDGFNQWKRPSIGLALRTGCGTGLAAAVVSPFSWFSSLSSHAVYAATAIAAVGIAVWTAMAYFVFGRLLFRALPDSKTVLTAGDTWT